MTKRITITYKCNHKGNTIAPIEEKYWDATPTPGKVCWCCIDPEKNLPTFTPMTYTVKIEEMKPE